MLNKTYFEHLGAIVMTPALGFAERNGVLKFSLSLLSHCCDSCVLQQTTKRSPPPSPMGHLNWCHGQDSLKQQGGFVIRKK